MSQLPYKPIDQNTWKRAQHCAVFKNCPFPQYCVTMDLDVTHFYQRVKECNWSFTFAFQYLTAKCANEIEEFRCRFLNGDAVLYNKIHTYFTYLTQDELFKVVRVNMQDTMEEYICAASRAVKEQTQYFAGPPENDVFQFSAMPWVAYTHISHTFNGNPQNAIPLFDWGKFEEKNGRKRMPFSVQVHHSFVDGIHIGKLADSLQKALDEV